MDLMLRVSTEEATYCASTNFALFPLRIGNFHSHKYALMREDKGLNIFGHPQTRNNAFT